MTSRTDTTRPRLVLPELHAGNRRGLVIATTERLRIATAAEEEIADVRLEEIRLTHDEDNVFTMMVRPSGRPTEPLTLVFAKRRSPVGQFLRDKYADDEPGGSPKAGLRKLLPGS